MIVSRTPFRVSFFGGGTDYPAWYREHGGSVLAASIDKYCYLSVRYLPPFFEHKFRVVYSNIELCASISQIKHPAVREVLKYLQVERGIEIHHDGDLPARSGMGSSSAFTVGALLAVQALHGKFVGKHELMNQAIHVEQDRIAENVGSQDQVMTAHGGFNCVRFHTSGDITIHPMILRPERLAEFESHLMLVYTGIKRTASDVASTYVHDLQSRRRQLRIINDLVKEAMSILAGSSDLRQLGELLHESWIVKRKLGEQISSSVIDSIYDEARNAGSYGGKLLGAGGGGFMLLFAPPERQQAIKERLKSLLHVPFKFEFAGSQVIYCDPQPTVYADSRPSTVAAFTEMQPLAML